MLAGASVVDFALLMAAMRAIQKPTIPTNTEKVLAQILVVIAYVVDFIIFDYNLDEI